MADWRHVETIGARRYTCGYCNLLVGPDRGYRAFYNSISVYFVYICSNCEKATFFDSAGVQTPGVPFGDAVGSLPDDLGALYDEARRASSVASYTASVLTCRKILMHIAVAQGAEENQNFLTYVTYLAESGYVPPNGKGWVDHIRKRGNDANHEIVVMDQNDSEELIGFVEMLLKFIYEFPSRIPSVSPAEN